LKEDKEKFEEETEVIFRDVEIYWYMTLNSKIPRYTLGLYTISTGIDYTGKHTKSYIMLYLYIYLEIH
jgi:hypothetical protein